MKKSRFLRGMLLQLGFSYCDYLDEKLSLH